MCKIPLWLEMSPLKGLSHEIFTVIFLAWMDFLGLNDNRYWFLNFKEGYSILNSCFKYWCVPYQTFSEIENWVHGSPIFLRNAAKGVNTSRRFYESPRMIANQFRGSPRIFFNNISVSLRQLSILLGDSTNLREGLVWITSKLKIAAKKLKELYKKF